MKRIIIMLFCLVISACGVNKSWDIKNMDVAKELQPQENIIMELIEQTNESLTVEFKNNDNDPWIYGERFAIQVLVDNEWYIVPSEMVFNLIGYNLYPNESITKTYDISSYGTLPSGTYRLVVSNLAVEFIIE